MLLKSNLHALYEIKDYAYLQYIDTVQNKYDEKIYNSMVLEYVLKKYNKRADAPGAYII